MKNCFVSKKTLKAQIAELEDNVAKLAEAYSALLNENQKYKENYPLILGNTVYDVQLRNEKGRYAKSNAVKEYSKVNEVIVDKKNYFSLVDRYNNNDVFLDKSSAMNHLESVCIK